MTLWLNSYSIACIRSIWMYGWLLNWDYCCFHLINIVWHFLFYEHWWSEWGSYAMEFGNSSTGLDHLLLDNKVIGQILACSRTRVQSQYKHGRNQPRCGHSLQWKHEALARHCHEPIQESLDEIRGQWHEICGDVQFWLIDKYHEVPFSFQTYQVTQSTELFARKLSIITIF